MWFVRHNRATDTRHFGPFETYEEAQEFCAEHGVSPPYILPLTRDHSWNETDADVARRLLADGDVNASRLNCKGE